MNAVETPWFRELFDEILAYRGHALFGDVFTPWIERAQGGLSEFNRFRTFSPRNYADEAENWAAWNLYALNRVNDLLLTSFEPVRHRSRYVQIRRDEYESLFWGLGFTVVAPSEYCPFHHEVVHAIPSEDADEPIGVLEILWPGLMWGEMAFSRAGVTVLGGRNHIVPETAEQSTLYFTFDRVNRKTTDLSRGWGSNSQWRTECRRNYQSNGLRIYNADGERLLNTAQPGSADRDGLALSERIELCRNRCFVTTSKADDDLFPYHDRYEERVEG